MVASTCTLCKLRSTGTIGGLNWIPRRSYCPRNFLQSEFFPPALLSCRQAMNTNLGRQPFSRACSTQATVWHNVLCEPLIRDIMLSVMDRKYAVGSEHVPEGGITDMNDHVLMYIRCTSGVICARCGRGLLCNTFNCPMNAGACETG